MTYRIVVRPEVDTDLRGAEEWYERQQAGLGRRFLQVTRQAMASLMQDPLIYPVRFKRKQVR